MKTKNMFWIYSLTTIGLILILTNSCKKDDNGGPDDVYTTVTIGTQVWMVENLKVTKYSNGDDIPNVTDGTQWSSLTTGAYCNFDNNATNATTYGRLYNQYAIETGNLCPTGWHVPTDAEWTTLEDFLKANGYSYDGTTPGINIAKSLSSTTLWKSSTLEGAVGNTDYPAYRNKSGFTALPGGYRHFDGVFDDLGNYGYWWTASEAPQSDGWYRMWSFSSTYIAKNHTNPRGGFSVRCVKN